MLVTVERKRDDEMKRSSGQQRLGFCSRGGGGGGVCCGIKKGVRVDTQTHGGKRRNRETRRRRSWQPEHRWIAFTLYATNNRERERESVPYLFTHLCRYKTM